MSLERRLLATQSEIAREREEFLQLASDVLLFFQASPSPRALLEPLLPPAEPVSDLEDRLDWFSFLQEKRFEAYLNSTSTEAAPLPPKRSGNIIMMAQEGAGPKIVERRGRKKKVKEGSIKDS